MATNKRRALPLAAFAVLAMSTPIVARAQSNENGYGPDPDGDTNPATRTRASTQRSPTRFQAWTQNPMPPHQHTVPAGAQGSRGVS